MEYNIKIKINVAKALNKIESVLALSNKKLTIAEKRRLNIEYGNLLYVCNEQSAGRIFEELAAVWAIDIIHRNGLDLCGKHMLLLSNTLMNCFYYEYIENVMYEVSILFSSEARVKIHFNNYNNALLYYKENRNFFCEKHFTVFLSLSAIADNNYTLLMSAPQTRNTMLFYG